MKFIFAFLMMALVSSAFANDQQTLSQLISSNYQSMMDEQAPGNYTSVVRVSYLVQVEGECSESMPVILLPATEISVPSKMEDCSENSDSIACSLASAAFHWYEANQPLKGQFQINLQLGTKEKEITFQMN